MRMHPSLPPREALERHSFGTDCEPVQVHHSPPLTNLPTPTKEPPAPAREPQFALILLKTKLFS